jgi:hypothetical protein
VKILRVALTEEQCVRYDLPSTPLKSGEKRAGKWFAAWGREQTEIDALAALRPDVLTQIANGAVAPFYDDALDERAEEAQAAWEDEAREAIESHPDYEVSKELVGEALTALRAAVAQYDEARAMAEAALADTVLPLVELVDPEDEYGEDEFDVDDDCVFDSRADFADASRKLKDQKAYDDA